MNLNLRGGDDDFGIDQFLVEFGVLAFLVGGRDQSMAFFFEPRSQTQLILSCSEETGLVFGMRATLTSKRILLLR